MSTDSKYEQIEARAMLGRAYGAMKESRSLREKAVPEAYEAVLGLNDVGGLRVQEVKEKGDLSLSLGERSVRFGWHGTGFAVWRAGRFGQVSHVTEIPLAFDAITGRFEGIADDTFTEPPPGQPRKRRAALAVIVEHALTLMATKGVDD